MRELITSRKNPLLQQVRRLLSSRREREKSGLFVADGTKLLQEAVRVGAKFVALSHNHPLGDVTPSSADHTVTEEARRIFDAVGIVFLDHLVVNERAYYPILYHRDDGADARRAFFYGEK